MQQLNVCLISPSLTAGLLRLLLCDELPQPDQHVHASRSCQGRVSTLLFDSLESGQPYFLSTFLPSICASAFPHYALMVSLVEQIRQQHPNVKVKYLAGYCFSGTYILTLLTEGYNFTSESYSHVKFIEKVSRSQSTPFLSRASHSDAPSLSTSYPTVAIINL